MVACVTGPGPFEGVCDPGWGSPWFCPRYLGSSQQISLERVSEGQRSLVPTSPTSVPHPWPCPSLHQNRYSSVSEEMTESPQSI